MLMSMGKIRVLSDETINQIAAGEVIEDVASVVKELVDNSLDAGASEIGIDLVGAGRQLIRVADDGCGMEEGDALLAFERHATSKIVSAEDLVGVETRGFRGEALPSIASVARVTLLTSPAPPRATRVEGGEVRPDSRSRGTTIEVEGLFHNVPVRRAFQRALSHDVAQVRRVVSVLALAHPGVRFRLTHGDKELLNLPAGDLEERARDVLGAEFFSTMVPLEAEGIHGFVGRPTASKPNRLGQYLYVNGRPTLSRLLSDALKEAFGQRIPEGRHPTALLFFELPGELVDVNVHPQKREVRLRGCDDLKAKISAAFEAPEAPRVATPLKPAPFRPTFQPQMAPPEPMVEEPLPISPSVVALFSRYALIDPYEGSLALVDLQAALSRVLYESMRSTEEPASQLLLVPETLHLAPEEASLVERHLPALQRLGYSLESLGGGTILMSATPADLDDPSELLVELLGKLREEKRVTEDSLARLATEMASRRRRPFQREEASALIGRLLRCTHPNECPRGKRTIAPLSEKEFAQLLS
jgi:DNA mismatch repair protein MutL